MSFDLREVLLHEVGAGDMAACEVERELLNRRCQQVELQRSSSGREEQGEQGDKVVKHSVFLQEKRDSEGSRRLYAMGLHLQKN